MADEAAKTDLENAPVDAVVGDLEEHNALLVLRRHRAAQLRRWHACPRPALTFLMYLLDLNVPLVHCEQSGGEEI